MASCTVIDPCGEPTTACCFGMECVPNVPVSQCPTPVASCEGPTNPCGPTGPGCCYQGTCYPNVPSDACLSVGGTPVASCEGVICPPPGDDCGPTPDQRACKETTCPIANERCVPKCVIFNPATGQWKVEKCECDNVEFCRIGLPPPTTAQPCTTPDNGAGTAAYPPNCPFVSPDDDMVIIDGLPPGTTIRIDARIQSFFDVFTELTLDGEKQTWKAQVPMPMQGTGTLAGFMRNKGATASGQTHTGPRQPGEPEQMFDTEMLLLQVQLPPGDPDFDLLRITAGTNFGLPSPGHTTIHQLPGGNWAVDSFFDITYRIDFVGAPGGPLAGRSGSTTGTIRMQAGVAVPKCVNNFCPPGEQCRRKVVKNTDGSYGICCVCEPVVTTCQVNATKTGCEGPCPNGMPCHPTKVHVGPNNQITVLECGCDDIGACHLEMGTAGPTCVGPCPDPNKPCRPVVTQTPGTTEYDLECKCVCDPALCEDGDLCTKDSCDPLTGQCKHEPIICPDDGDPCTLEECDPATGTCIVKPNPDCEACCFPSGAPCQQMLPGACQNAGGLPQGPGSTCAGVVCPPLTCAPTADGLRCKNTTCPNVNEKCRPVCVRWHPQTHQYRILECDCMNVEKCHVVIPTDGSKPRCEGLCPPGFECKTTEVVEPNGSITICCRCEPVGQPQCRPNPTRTGCETQVCPDGRPCRPSKIHVGPNNQITVLECDCKDTSECQLVLTAAGPDCQGACPTDPTQSCQRILTQTPGTTEYDLECKCVCDPAKCDDHDPCTEDFCNPLTGQCDHLPIVCPDDGDPCTLEYCDPAAGGCVRVPNPECQACCFPSGAPCQQMLPGACQNAGGIPQGPGSNCANVDCHNEPRHPKFQQPVSHEREDIASNINFNAPTLVNKVVSDDFRSDGRPITSVKWWGSYLDPAYIPRPFNPAEPKPMDGWLITFHRPLGPKPPTPQPALGIYFAPVEAVRISLTTYQPCDGHPVFEYAVDLSKCCLVDSNPDPRVPATDPCRCPARPDYFCERYCFRYSLSIQAVVGMRWEHPAGAECCQRVPNNNFADKDFWGWHTTDVEKGIRPALQSRLSPGTPTTNNCPLGECPITPPPFELWYGPWAAALPVCPPTHRVNMAFELWTNTPQVPPPCRQLLLVSATSVKTHGPSPGVDWGIDLPLGAVANAAVEPRSGGPTKIVLKFNQEIMADDGSLDIGDEVMVDPGDGTITGLSIAGDTLTVLLKDVPNKSCLHLTVENGPDGITTLGSDPLEGDNDVHVRVLLGDVNGTGVVNSTDIALVKSKSGLPLDASSYKMDLNVSGAISSTDIAIVKSASGSQAACP
ncbi:MAG: hypothetical protein HRF43_12535 [Phycisphaerae bacterium]